MKANSNNLWSIHSIVCFACCLWVGGCVVNLPEQKGSTNNLQAKSGQMNTSGKAVWQNIPDNRRDLIRAIQAQLNGQNYDAGPEDGLMGKKTRNAIMRYQASIGMAINGEVSQKLLIALRESQLQLVGNEQEVDPEPECESEESGSMLSIFHNSASVVVDCTCQELVEPFEISSNVEALTTIAYEESVTQVSEWMNNILSRSDGPSIKLEDVRRAAKRLNWLPLEIEKEYGEIIQEQRQEDGDLRILSRTSRKRSTRALYAQLDEILDKLKATIPADQPYEFNVLITDSLEVNAEAIPGGTIFLNKGALQNNLAYFVLGHELAHITKRHTTKAFQSKLIDAATTITDIDKLVSGRSALTNILDRTMALNKILLNYSKAQELQSDACAVRMLADAKEVKSDGEIQRFIKFLNKKAQEKPAHAAADEQTLQLLGRSFVVGSVSTHPNYPERIGRIESMSQLRQASN